jgi:hypothetical protein
MSGNNRLKTDCLTQLISRLDDLNRSSALARVMGVGHAKPCALNLWLLHIKNKGVEESRLLFGWVLPSYFAKPDNKPDKWFASDGGKWTTSKDNASLFSYRFPKLAYYGDGRKIFALVRTLAGGIQFAEACREVSLPKPPAVLAGLILAPTDSISDVFAVRPPVFLETREALRRVRQAIRPMESPQRDSTAVMGSLFRLDKKSLLPDIDPESETLLLRSILTHLADDTGMEFQGAAASRLGNIEWLVPSAVDDRGASVVDFGVAAGGIAKVTIRDGSMDIPPGTSLVVRCRLRNALEVVFDQCREIVSTAEPKTIEFVAGEEVSEIQVTIWKRSTPEADPEILYEYSCPLIRSISLNYSASRLVASLSTPRLQESSVKGPQSRHLIQQSRLHSKSVIGDYAADPWGESARDAVEVARRLFPVSSDGGYFPNGWADGRHGFMAFIEWFRKLTSGHERRKFILVDPYFDRDGVLDLISNSGSTQHAYVVLTSSQLSSDDDLPDADDSAQTNLILSRADRLRDACRQIRPILKGLDFRLLDMRHISGKSKQLFHDRYLLVEDEGGKLRKGFHLSNSIQGASKKFPLVITPIPEDVLEPVGNYVHTLLAGTHPEGKDVSVEELYPIRDLPPDSVRSIPDPAEIRRRLLAFGLIRENDDPFATWDDSEIPVKPNLSILRKMSPENFGTAWETLGDWSANLPNTMGTLLLESDGKEEHVWLADRLSELLVLEESGHSASADYSDDFLFERAALANMMKEEFATLVPSAWDSVQYISPIIGTRNYGGHLATQLLLRWYPSHLMRVLSTLRDRLKGHQNLVITDPGQVVSARRIRTILQTVREEIWLRGHSTVLPELLSADIPFLRALASQFLFQNVPMDSPASEIARLFPLLDKLSCSDRLHALAGWVFELRTEANRRNYTEEPDIQEKRIAIFSEMIERWIPDNEIDLATLIPILSGAGRAGWAISTNNDLLLSLVEKKVLSLDRVANYWLTTLSGRIGEHLGTDPSTAGFHPPADVELTEVAAWHLALCPSERHFSSFECLASAAWRTVRKPFSDSQHYAKWAGALRSLLWIHATILVAREYLEQQIAIGEQQHAKPWLEKFSTLADETAEVLIVVRQFRKFGKGNDALVQYVYGIKKQRTAGKGGLM